MDFFWIVLALGLPSPLAAQAGGAVPVPGFTVDAPAPTVTARAAASAAPSKRVPIAAGSFRPLYAHPGEERVQVRAFRMDERAVTRAEFARFVEVEPRWGRGRVPAVFAGDGYLASWSSPTRPGGGDAARRPVTEVSWFAAKSYCEAQGGRLPTTAEWEYVARASETETDAATSGAFRQRALELALGPRRGPPTVQSGFRNAWGVWGMHGGVSEWVLDFNTNFAATDSRLTNDQDRGLTCAAGATAGGSSGDYAAFLRYALRAASDGRSTGRNLGFRCAYDAS